MILRLHIAVDGLPPAGMPDGAVFETGKTFRIGREGDLDLALPDPTRQVSSLHCEISRSEYGFILRDVSTNGTFINGGQHRLTEAYTLQPGDTIRIGPYTVTVAVEDNPAAPPDADRTVLLRPGDQTIKIAPLRPTPNAMPRLTLMVETDTGGPQPPRASAERTGDGQILIGRGEEADLVLPDQQKRISRRHCSLAFNGGVCTLVEHSTNGTFRDGSTDKLAAGTVVVAGDRLRLGPHVLTIGIENELPQKPLADQPIPKPPASAAPADAPADAPAAPRRSGDPAAMVAAPTGPPSTGAGKGGTAEMTFIAKPPPGVHRALPTPTPTPAAVGDLCSRLAAALGIRVEDVAAQSGEELAEQLATIVSMAAEMLNQILAQRAAEGALRPLGQQGNNPLEVFADKRSALRALFGPPQRLFLDPVRAFQQSLEELHRDQDRLRTKAAAASTTLIDTLSPEAIQALAGRKRPFRSHKARLWDHYVTAWNGLQGQRGQAD